MAVLLDVHNYSSIKQRNRQLLLARMRIKHSGVMHMQVSDALRASDVSIHGLMTWQSEHNLLPEQLCK